MKAMNDELFGAQALDALFSEGGFTPGPAPAFLIPFKAYGFESTRVSLEIMYV